MSAAGEDELPDQSYDTALLRRLLRYLRPYVLEVALALVLIALMAGLDLVGPYLTKLAIDEHMAKGQFEGLLPLAALYLGALVLAFGVRYAQVYVLQMTGQKVVLDLRRELFGHLQRLSPAYFDKHPVGRLMTRVTSDVDAINEFFTSGAVTVFGDLMTLVGIMAVLLSLNWRLALVTFTVVPLFVLVTDWFRRGARQSFRDVRRQIARLNAFLQEQLTGLTVVQLYGREPQSFARFSEINREHRDANLRSIFYYAVFYPAIDLLAALAVALILIYGGDRVLAGALTMGALVAFVQYSERFWRPISDLSEKFNILQAAMASSERIFGLLDAPVTILPPAAPRRLGPVRGEIRFERVSFGYSAQEPVLHEVDFTVTAGQSVALVGATGAGKSSIISLLLRFYDVTSGRITLDGVDLRELDPQELRAATALVLQDVHLFQGTIASNIALGSPITEERVRAAAEAVGAAPFIAQLSGGFAAEVKERGATLSVGQKQLLALARALAHDPRVLILDEATSSVDTETEQQIQRALKLLLRGRTAIVIAHRLSTVRDVDQILVLHKGRIRERGTHQELLAQRGLYWRLYELQYQNQEAGSVA